MTGQDRPLPRFPARPITREIKLEWNSRIQVTAISHTFSFCPNAYNSLMKLCHIYTETSVSTAGAGLGSIPRNVSSTDFFCFVCWQTERAD